VNHQRRCWHSLTAGMRVITSANLQLDIVAYKIQKKKQILGGIGSTI
jgi:hypothetical protein